MPWVGFETTIPVFEQARTVHVLDLAATMIGAYLNTVYNFQQVCRRMRVSYEYIETELGIQFNY
jgi:hypothetical protein